MSARGEERSRPAAGASAAAPRAAPDAAPDAALGAAPNDAPDEAPAAAPYEAPAMRLDDVLKFFGVAGTGGEAKHLIQSGAVRVNGVVETRRKHLLRAGDSVIVGDEAFVLELEPAEEQ